MKYITEKQKRAKVKGILITSPHSGSGKTTAACALIKALSNRMKVRSFKCGPDYIDPIFHKKVLGIPSKNLDSFFCTEDELKEIYAENADEFDIAVTEGVMGYYDGLSMDTTEGSSYDIAKKLGIPVILVINAKGAALTINAIIKGICGYKKDSGIKGIILNNISEGVFERIKPVIENEIGLPVAGFIPHTAECSFESRHLGLSFADSESLSSKIEKLGKIAEKYIDIDKITDISEMSGEIEYIEKEFTNIGKCVKIAVAMDDAFSFYYEENIRMLEKMGCNIEYFSPINDKKLPSGINGLILGGGYPELHLRELSENKTMLTDIKEKIEGGLPCLAECGGFMYLHKEIEDKEGKSFAMANIIGGKSYFTGKSVRFGYCTLVSASDNYALPQGEKIKAHEFHYFDSISQGKAFRAEKPNNGRKWDCIHTYKNLICGFPHLYYPSNPEFAENFVRKCAEIK